ncbi:MAG: hypothetical protein JWP37_3390 [Mucilaginibacter sp.]|nr:hypothetical protein [Mucilaginibacter sp.]
MIQIITNNLFVQVGSAPIMIRMETVTFKPAHMF